MLGDLLKFWESNTFERQLYWMVKTTVAPEQIYEIEWRKGQTFAWRYRVKNEEFWTQVTAENLVFMMGKLHMDTQKFENDLRSAILQQGVFADMIYHKISDFLGKNVLSEAIEANKRFLAELLTVVESFIGEADANTNAKKSRHLKLL